MKKKHLFAGLLIALAAVLTACGGAAKEETEEAGTSAGAVLFEEEEGSTWSEKWQVETASSAAVNVNIHARISTLGQKQMSTMDVKRYEFSDENIKKLADAVFDEKPDDYKGKTRKRKENGKTVLKERIITGIKNGLKYDLKFSTTYYGERGESIELIPDKIQDIAPDSLKDCDYISSYGRTDSDSAFKEQKNACSLTRTEASNMAQQFLEETGFSDWILVGGKEVGWDASYEEHGGVENKNVTGYKDGYEFEYAVGVQGIAFYQCGYKSVGSTTITEVDGKEVVEEHENNEYSRQCYLTVEVTDDGVVQVEWYNPLEILSATDSVKLLPFERIKDAVKNEMKEYALYYYNRKKRHVSFDRMQLVYYRLDSPDEKDRFTYVPAWVLWSKSSAAAYFVNAMDGSIIKDWDDDWGFETSI